MKRLMFMTIISIGISMVLGILADAKISQRERWILAYDFSEMAPGFRFNEESKDLRVHRTGDYGWNQEAVNPQKCEEAQPNRSLPDILAQPMGRRCTTPSGSCELPNPAPINSPCCCPFACGYVGS